MKQWMRYCISIGGSSTLAMAVDLELVDWESLWQERSLANRWRLENQIGTQRRIPCPKEIGAM